MPSFIRRHADHPVDAIEPWLRWVLGDTSVPAAEKTSSMRSPSSVEVRPG